MRALMVYVLIMCSLAKKTKKDLVLARMFITMSMRECEPECKLTWHSECEGKRCRGFGKAESS